MFSSPVTDHFNLLKGSIIVFFLLIAFLSMDNPMTLFDKNEAINQDDYLDQNTLDSSTIIENTTTSEQNDYFVIDENNDAFFVTLMKNKDGVYDHALLKINQQKDTDIMNMLTESTKNQNKQEKE